MKYTVESSADGTKLLVFENKMKTVLIPAINDKFTVCISTQIGCGMKCAFCRSGKFERDLTAEEISEQVSTASELIDRKPTSIVVMGMGEPMLNFTAVSSALKKIHDELEVSYKRMTLSTCGLHLDKLIDVPYPVAVSLHSAYQVLRDKLVPYAATVLEIVSFAKKLADKKRGLMIEYVLIKDVNDSDIDLDRLLGLDWPMNVNFNLIEFNDSGEYHRSLKLLEWKAKILDAGYKCFIRESRGSDIEAACGMLDTNLINH